MQIDKQANDIFEKKSILNIIKHFFKGVGLNKVKKRKTIFYASPIIPDFDHSSGGKRAFLMLKLLSKRYEVYCYAPVLYKKEHQKAIENLGIKVIRKTKKIKKLKKTKKIDVIIIAWFRAYKSISGIIKRYPRAKIIVDTVDLHWLREERSLETCDNMTPEIQKANKKDEIEVYRNADIIWTVTREDKKALLREIPNADVRVVSNIHIMKPDSFIKNKPDNILFFGGYKHPPSVNGAKILAEKIFPKIRAKNKNAKLLIAGADAPKEIIDLGKRKGVEVLGFIDHDKLKKIYAKSKLTIVPLTEGAGIKGKICEAIEYRVPVITNDIGNEGICLDNEKDGFITNDYDKMAEYALRVLSDDYDLESITKAAQAKVRSLLSPEANLKVMSESIKPTVDICIVTYNKKDLLEKCINSIYENTKYPNFNIIVYSNGCSDGTREYLKKLSKEKDNVEVIVSDTNDVFVIPNNRMMLINPTHDVVLLNNDVLVTKGWLRSLVWEAYRSRKVGIVGSKILCPNNKLQEFGSELYINGLGSNIGRNKNPNELKYMKSKKASYVSGCSMYIKRKTVCKIGVFDEQFHPCYAEDSDYCYTAWENDIHVNVTPNSVIYHLEGATSGTDINSGFKKFQTINIKKFLVKHSSTIQEINQKVHKINSNKLKTIRQNMEKS